VKFHFLLLSLETRLQVVGCYLGGSSEIMIGGPCVSYCGGCGEGWAAG
jgi:hypothetical protein